MGALTKRKWLSVSVLAVVLPISLLVAFRLTGVLLEPLSPETIVVKARSCNVERTLQAYTYAEWVENSHSDDMASVNLEVDVDTYSFRYGWTLYEYLMLHIVATANVSSGFIHSMTVEFSKGDNYTSTINIMQDPKLLELHNLTLQKVRDSGVGLRENYIMTTGKDGPDNCRLVTNVDWIFLNKDIDHNVTITLKTTYFNGTTYRKIVIPIHLVVRADAGNCFGAPKAIIPGCYWGYLSPILDSEDCYAVFLKADQTIHVHVTPHPYLDVNLYLYAPDKDIVANSSLTEEGGAEEVIFKAESTGLFFICLSTPARAPGSYTLIVSINQDGG